MLQLLETGRALYALAALCVLGILTRMITRHAYKRLLKESKDLSLTKNHGNQAFCLERHERAVDVALFAAWRRGSLFLLLVSSGYLLCSFIWRRSGTHGYADHAV